MPWHLSSLFRRLLTNSGAVPQQECHGQAATSKQVPSKLPPRSGTETSRSVFYDDAVTSRVHAGEKSRERALNTATAGELCNWKKEFSMQTPWMGFPDDSAFLPTTLPIKCSGCQDAAVGLVMVAGELKFHPECFLCCHCRRIIGVSEPFVVLGHAVLFCEDCFRDKQESDRANNLPVPILTRMIEVPARADHAARIQINLKLCTGPGKGNKNVRIASFVDSALDDGAFQHLQVDDRILEVDGLAVTSRNWQEAQKLLQSTPQKIHVIIERGPPAKKEEKINKIEGLSDLDNILPVRKDPLRSRAQSLGRRRSRSSSLPRTASLDEPDYINNSTSRCVTAMDKCSPQKPEFLRAFSHRHDHRGHRAFAPSDLLEMEELGRGTYGITYKVQHRDTKEVMTMKKLYRFDRAAQEDFLRESAVLRNVDHPNVLRFIGVVIKGQNLHIITEYVSGGSLEDFINDLSTPFCWGRRVRAARDIAGGLSYLHSMSIIHRDLKVDNCLIREDESVVVADFGLACILQKIPADQRHSVADCSLTETDGSFSGGDDTGPTEPRKRRNPRGPKRQTVCGNAFCMAPEMLKHSYDERVDIFSFAVILVQMIARTASDPEIGVPRSKDFGLDRERIGSLLVGPDTPPLYLHIAFLAGDVNPDKRPSFTALHIWLDRLFLCIEAKLPVSQELQSEVSLFATSNAVTPAVEANGSSCALLRAASEPFFDLDSAGSSAFSTQPNDHQRYLSLVL